MTEHGKHYAKGSAAERDIASCHVCMKLSPQSHQQCDRCGSPLHLRKTDSINRTLALTLSSLILYLPANLLPIMNTASLGNEDPSTIIGGVILLWQLHSYPVALVILLASVIVPSAKMASLFYLCWSVKKGPPTNAMKRTVMYRMTELIGRWSMVDVFVVAILVGLVQLGGLISILPGFGAVYFCAVVVLTIFAAECFDSRLIWDQVDTDKPTSDSQDDNHQEIPKSNPNKANELSYE